MIKKSFTNRLRQNFKNETIISLYWIIGKFVLEKAQNNGWGRSTVKQLSRYILSKEPGIRGYSAQNIWRMKQFFETYQDKPEFEVTFLSTMILFRDNADDLEELEQLMEVQTSPAVKQNRSAIAAPITGEVKPLSECQDQVFAEGTLGKGVIIEPIEGKVYAPCDGVVSEVFDTLHAIGIQSDNEAEILIHVGMDTVRLNGQGFKAHVQNGEKIRNGQLLLEFDMDFIRSQGLPLTTPVIVTNPENYPDMRENLGNVKHGDELITLN